MASKSHTKSCVKEKSPKQNGKVYQQDALPDEIALRDEILQLKRQIMTLKKANEHNLVKVRKYEDEAKRKDRQIEQLMDPTKNADIRKILSTKGAAILMNLKDQNNALIQMILDKDLQIKRLLGELKTSKLYATTRKTEPYRIEITRLRNLLIKSQELLKEATDAPQKRSICVGGTPILEENSSSDQSSPRELEELRFTIQSLETHMKYSNELLAKKNQEIMILTDQLNSARNAYQCKICNKKMTIKPSLEFELQSKYDWFESEKISDETSASRKPETDESESTKTFKSKTSSAELLELFERTMTITKERKIKTKIPKSAPACSTTTRIEIEKDESSPRRGSMPVLFETKTESTSEDAGKLTTSTSSGAIWEDLEKLKNQGRRKSKSLLQNVATLDEFDSSKLESDDSGKNKWKNTVKKITKSRRNLENKKPEKANDSDLSADDTDFEAYETYEFEMMEKKIESDNLEELNDKLTVKSPSQLKLTRQTNLYNTEKESQKENKSKKVIISEGNKLIESNGKVPTIPKRRSSTSNGKTTSKKSNDGTSRNSKKISRNKKIEETTYQSVPPIPLKRTKIGTALTADDKPGLKLSSTRNSSPVVDSSANSQFEPKIEKINEIPETSKQEPDEIITYQINPVTDTQQIKDEINSISSRFSPEIQKELKSLYDNITSYEEIEKKKAKSLREVYRQSVDSSFDSENSSRQEPKVVEVEVEINPAPMNEENQTQEDTEIKEPDKKEGGESFLFEVINNEDNDDDDDVVFH